LAFRHPRLPIELMNEMYADASGTAWRYAFNERADWIVARRWIAEQDMRTLDVLDVGCADGHFLVEGVSTHHRRYGIEINPAASAAAISTGVRWVGLTLEDLALSPGRRFDVITAFDVLEHVFDPRDFVARASQLLRKDGRLIIATGNLTSRTFEFMGAKYWYACIAEHVSFVSPAWCDAIAGPLGLRRERTELYSHACGSYVQMVCQPAANCLYRLTPKGLGLMRRVRNHIRSSKQSITSELMSPNWMTARDHFITEFRQS
jgi:SAM-dependent methyltransferase